MMYRHFTINFLTIGAQIALTLVTGILAARLLGPEARGEFAAIQMLPSALLAFATWGTPAAIAFFTAKNPEHAGCNLGAALAISLAATLPLIAAGFVFIPQLLHNYRPEIIHAAQWFFAGMLICMTLYSAPSSTFQAIKSFKQFNLLRILATVTYTGAIVTTFLSPNPIRISFIYLTIYALVALGYAAWAYRHFIRQAITFRWADIRAMLPYSSFTLLTILPVLAGQRLDQFFVLAVLDARALGIYTVAVGVGQMFYSLQLASGNVLLPYLAGTSDNRANQIYIFNKLVRVTLLILTPMLLGLLVTLPILIPVLFGGEFSDAIIPAALLVLTAAITGLNATLYDGFRGFNLPLLPLWPEMVGLVIKVVLLAIVGTHLTLNQAAGIAFIGAASSLGFTLAAYHLKIHAFGGGWFADFKTDITDIIGRLTTLARTGKF